MPLEFCHPTAPHEKLRLPEWYVSSLMMDRALDAVVRRVQECRVPESSRSQSVIEHQTNAIEATFALLERATAKFPAEPTIGEIAVCSAIGYLDLRVPNDGWRGRYPKLARWLDGFSRRPSVEATKPPPA